MERLQKLVSAYYDLKRKSIVVNKIVYPIDPNYVWYKLFTTFASQLQTLALFVAGSALIGQVVETGAPSWTLVASGIAAYGLYLCAVMTVRDRKSVV